jgi:chromate reductase
MTAPEAYVQVTPGMITGDGEVTEASTEQFLRNYMDAFGIFVNRVHTALALVR